MLRIDQTRTAGERPRRRRASPEVRRLEILEVATDVFLEHGYEAGAMSEVARRLGGSKETLYRYFDSKQQLFAAVVREAAARRGRIFSEVSESGDLAFDLGRLGRALLTFVSSEEHLALRRAVIAEAGKTSDLGKLYFELGRGPASEAVAARLAKAMEQGGLRRADPWTAAMHFRGLCQSGLYDLRLEGVVEALAPEQIARAADAAVDVFLRAYAPLPAVR